MTEGPQVWVGLCTALIASSAMVAAAIASIPWLFGATLPLWAFIAGFGGLILAAVSTILMWDGTISTTTTVTRIVIDD